MHLFHQPTKQPTRQASWKKVWRGMTSEWVSLGSCCYVRNNSALVGMGWNGLWIYMHETRPLRKYCSTLQFALMAGVICTVALLHKTLRCSTTTPRSTYNSSQFYLAEPTSLLQYRPGRGRGRRRSPSLLSWWTINKKATNPTHSKVTVVDDIYFISIKIHDINNTWWSTWCCAQLFFFLHAWICISVSWWWW